ncbi:hypothetical protein [Streptomyces sp. WELS2]|uniref:hypothetical protein n=1 Tax=Streptomyces sp. WELS2 TaxID=2749435 RepID=UPI0015F0B770|nr:hypothetical protein [Streptomyces sp. WELS2]
MSRVWEIPVHDSTRVRAAIPLDAPGVIAGDTATGVLSELTRLLGAHRVWERFPSAA